MARAGEPVDSDGSDEWALMRPPDKSSDESLPEESLSEEEYGRKLMKTLSFLGRWYLTGPAGTGTIFWGEPG